MTTEPHHYLRKLCTDAVTQGFTLVCVYDGEVDYRGANVDKAIEAMTACDEMVLRVVRDGKSYGWALIVNEAGQDPIEQIADTAGSWVSAWWDANVRTAIS